MSAASGQFAPGAVRTATPFLVGWLISFLGRQGFDVNDDNAAYLIGAVGGYLFYLAARAAEVFLSEKWKYVLGLGLVSGSTAIYAKPKPPGEPLEEYVSDLDSGRGTLGTIGVVLAVVAAVLLVLHLLGVFLTSIVAAVVVLIIGVVLVLVDGNARL